MYAFVTVLIILLCLFIILVVLVQNPKGGGLGAGFGGAASNIMGAKRTGDLLEKLTWGSALLLFVLAIFSTFIIGGKQTDTTELKSSTVTEEVINPDRNDNNTIVPTQITPEEQE